MVALSSSVNGIPGYSKPSFGESTTLLVVWST